MERTSAWSTYTPENITELERLSDRYKEFLNKGKTERECVTYAVELAESHGFRNLQDYIDSGRTPESGAGLERI